MGEEAYLCLNLMNIASTIHTQDDRNYAWFLSKPNNKEGQVES